jgi:transposase
MRTQAILPDPAKLRLICLHADGDGVILAARTVARSVRCPLCDSPSRRIHSRYLRSIADLPRQGISVRLRLHARRFFCDNPVCERRIFTERLPTVVAPYSRRTHRLDAWFTQVAFALGGEPGARLLRALGIDACGDTLLNRIRSFQLGRGPAPRILSVDDFAFRRGRTYGSILIDLERHRVVDLLLDRSGAALARWLADNPGVEVVSRDRGGDYADGVRQGAPDAVQVADRFHLLQNLGEAAEKILKGHTSLVQSVPCPGSSHRAPAPPRSDREAVRERTKAKARTRHEAVHAMAAKGMSGLAIARSLGIHRHTVATYLASDTPPERPRFTHQASILAPYEAYLLERWRQGYRNGVGLWREIEEMGYPGGRGNISRFVAHLRKQELAGERLPRPSPGLTPRQAAGLLLARPEALTEPRQAAVERLKALHPDIQIAAMLLGRFAQMIRTRADERPREQLDRWMADAEGAGLPELKAFVTKLRQDVEAVLAGLSLPYSQGQTEGRINKLKLIKRSMFGRAKFDLDKVPSSV